MVDQQVVDYIKKALIAGQTKEQIKKALIDNGWTETEVNENILTANPEPQQPIQPENSELSQENQQTVGEKSNVSANINIQNSKTQENSTEIKPDDKPNLQPSFQPDKQSAQIQPETQQQIQQPATNLEPKPNFDYNAQQANIENQNKTQLRPGETVYQFQHQEKLNKSERKSNGLVGLLIYFSIVVMVFALSGAAFIYFDIISHINNLIKPIIVEYNYQNNEQNQTSTKTIFANYLDKTAYNPQIPDYTIDLSELTNLANFEKSIGKSFTDDQKTSLVNNNFFITSNYDKFYSANTTDFTSRNDDWTSLYQVIGGSGNKSERLPENAVFISTDYLMHVYHKLLEQEFSYIEETQFYPILSSLSDSLLISSLETEYNNAEQEQSYKRLAAYFLVSSAILQNAKTDFATLSSTGFIEDTGTDKKINVIAIINSLSDEYKIPKDIKDIAQEEIELIFDASKFSISPLMGQFQTNMLEDYTQYKPRSHYAKNVVLRDYFRAMMWFGRMNFLLNSKELTRDAANISLLMTEAQHKQWESIYKPTSFFVGESDDLTLKQIKNAIALTGFSASDESDQVVEKLQIELEKYSNPLIMSSVIEITTDGISKEELQKTTKGFRFMGQRFTPDAFIFSSLTQGDEKADEETGQKLPSTPTALMVSTLMGDVVSKDLLNTWIATNAKNSDKILAKNITKLENYFNETTDEQWTQNIYWSWIYTIKSLFNSEEDKTGYPVFMKNSDWNKKSTQTFLGSWTELKHDTLLYAKQSYAEMGGGGGEEKETETPKGYVEPNIEFFDRLIALIKTTNSGLNNYNLMPANFQAKNQSLIESLQFLRKIAVAELSNKIISDDDFEQLRLNAYALDQLLQSPDSPFKLESNARSALIADVHTDAKNGQILYEANGIPNYIYVAVKDANGTRLTKGLVYSYYEFTNPIGKRLDDETWQKWNYSSTIKLLKMQDWNKALLK